MLKDAPHAGVCVFHRPGEKRTRSGRPLITTLRPTRHPPFSLHPRPRPGERRYAPPRGNDRGCSGAMSEQELGTVYVCVRRGRCGEVADMHEAGESERRGTSAAGRRPRSLRCPPCPLPCPAAAHFWPCWQLRQWRLRESSLPATAANRFPHPGCSSGRSAARRSLGVLLRRAAVSCLMCPSRPPRRHNCKGKAYGDGDERR